MNTDLQDTCRIGEIRPAFPPRSTALSGFISLITPPSSVKLLDPSSISLDRERLLIKLAPDVKLSIQFLFPIVNSTNTNDS